MPKEPNGKKPVATDKKVITDPKKESSLYYTGLGGGVGVNRPFTPAEWKEEAGKKGWEMIPSNAMYPSYKIPGKNYEIIKDGKKIRLPYEGYTVPTKNSPLIDPTRKPMDFNSGMGMYDPNSGLYMDTSGKLREPIIESYAKGGDVPPAKPASKKPQREPIYVEDKNDPRYKAYQDSLGLYKKTQDILNVENYDRDSYLQSVKDNPSDSYSGFSWGNLKHENSGPDWWNKHDIDIDIENIDGTRGFNNRKIKPIKQFDYGRGFVAPIYKKPVQPVVVGKSKADYLPPKQLTKPEAELKPQGKQSMAKAPEYKTELVTTNDMQIKRYKDKTGKTVREEYFDMSGKKIDPIIDEYKKGGKVKGYAVGGSPGFLETNPEVNKITNNGKNTPAQVLSGQTGTGAKTKSNNFSVSEQNAAAAGLNLATSALTSYNAKQKGEMNYGSNAYFDKMAKQDKTGDAILGVAGGAASAVNPLLGAAVNAIPALGNAISGADAYGVSDKSDARIAAGMLLNQKDQIRSIGRGAKEIGKGNIGRGLAYMTPLGGLIMNDERKYEREKLKYENEQGQNQLEYDQAVEDRQAQGKYNIQNALAMRNEGIANYKSNDFVKDPTLKQAEFKAPEKSKTLTAFGLAKGGSVKGGTIKGAGTGTSDSIDAQVQGNSFVVPAKNNKIAKTLREVMLGDEPDTKAKVKQGVGPKVKLSNGEHLFTPAERAKLEANGVNLYDLAPDAEDNDEFSKGGDTKMKKQGFAAGGGVDDSYLRSEKAKIAAERAENTKRLGATRADQIANQKTERLNVAIKDLLAQQANDRKKAEVEYNAALRDYEKVKKSYEYTRKPNKTIQDKEEAMLSGYQQPYSSNLTPDQKLAESETALKRLETQKARLEKAKKDYEFSTNESNYVNTKNLTPYIAGTKMQSTPRQTASSANDPFGILSAGKGETSAGATMGADPYGVAKNKPATAAKPSDPATSPLIAPAPATGKKATIATAGAKKTLGTDYNPMMSDTFDPNAFAFDNQGELPEAAPTSPTSLADAALSLKPDVKAMQPIIPDDPTLTKDVQDVTNSGKVNPTGSKFGWQDGLGAAINYGLPLAQSIIGFNQLQKVGDRPIDKLDTDLVSAFDTTRDNATKANLAARYGMSPEEMASLRMQNAALTNTGRYAARNFSGGSSANALNMERSVINDSFNRALQAKVADKNLQMQKQQNAYGMQNAVNSLAQYKQEANRRLFQDDLTAFQQKTDAAATLMGTGLSNLSDMSAADRRMREFKKLNSK